MPIRWVDEWDNPDGTIERGYAGRSIFFEGGNVREDLAPVAEYARLLASVGINGCNVNNVNAAPQLLDSDHLKQLARIADAMRPWGVRLALSVDFASPQKIGGLPTFDPLDPAVKAWWTASQRIYTLIPDFAGFTVKADSEGRPAPPATAALRRRRQRDCRALKPHGGSFSIAALSTTTTSTGATPRLTVPARPTTFSIRWTASSPPTSSSKPNRPHRLSGARTGFAALWRPAKNE